MRVNETEVELSVGETVKVGELAVTILEIDGDAIQFRIDPPHDQPESSIRFDMRRWLPPR
jgi:hypothetical protein